MNIGHEPTIDREPLTPEERELAQRLSRLGPSAGPHAHVDAHILAAAHDAVAASRPRNDARKARRWPVALGVAASLALAVGVAWRLRPLPEPPPLPTAPATRTAPAAAVALEEKAHDQAVSEATAPEPDAQAEHAVASASQQARQAPKRELPAPPPVQMPAIVDEARSRDVQVPPPPPSPPAAAPMAADTMDAAGADTTSLRAPPEAVERLRKLPAAPVESDAVAASKETQERAGQRVLPPPPAQPAAATATAHEEPQAVEDIDEQGADNGDDPPAYASSPQVREAWLQRIRELVAEGKRQEAHDSLHEFLRRYPHQPLPDDLQRFKRSQSDPTAP